MTQVLEKQEDLYFEISSGRARNQITYTTEQLIPSEHIDRRVVVREAIFYGKTKVIFYVLHYGGTLPVLHTSDKHTILNELPGWHNVEFHMPCTTPQIETVKKRIKEIEKSPFEEIYFDGKTIRLRNLHDIDEDDLITEADLEKIGLPEEEKSILDEVTKMELEKLNHDIGKSKLQKEGLRMLQMTSNDVINARKLVDYCAVPPMHTSNPIKNDQINEWIEKFINENCLNVAQMLLNDIIALVKYTKYDEDFFGITNEDLGIVIGNTRKTFAEMRNMHGINRVTVGLDTLIKGIAIILPADEELIQRKVMDPSLPSSALKTAAHNLTQ